MKQIRYCRFFSVLCAFLIVLSACDKSKPQSSNTQQDPASHSMESQTTAEEKNELNKIETHISVTLSSGVEVTANVVISDNVSIEQLAIYDAEIVKQDYELLKQLLLENKEIIDETSAEMAEARTNSQFHSCVTSDGSSLSYTGEGFTFQSGLYSLMQNILHGKEVDVNQFSGSEDLSFSTQEEAKQDIENILKQLNLQVEEPPICYTLSFESLQSICEKLNAARMEAFGNDSPLYTPFTTSSADACYIFVYQIAADGLPISTNSNGVFGDGSWTSGTTLYCFYSEKGLVGMELPYSLRVTGKASQTSPGISVNQVLERVDNKFNSMILVGDYQVSKIEFEYIPMPVNGSRNLFKLVPAWRVSIFHTYETKDEKSKDEIFSVSEQFDAVFNAITGEELMTSSGSA